ncbi:Cof-type HAD-IIB family hydrolase [Mycoplasmopsis gallopavonis]|uniref:Putative phosphotransferase n=1 Tax=Mycoplasmopsis gallopavonis TaxID=76629 RepID=A0A449AYF6_9BACT|nr:Cof-type HAD-IIB family hydrolase [Mycoplasmopsis gallopavonis]RIV16491.1 Cof-type HAD-IIB family hydrolase [Mycoplasmopsis gallopavonis]VEU72541.1 putative phosphotransferase [Mycoplasmopsis gallopavonis]VEU73330.1 putative phosphotransferase [Mycoplasmopsis gallopavonis]
MKNIKKTFQVTNYWFNKIVSGTKRIEIRLNTPERQNLKVGDLINIKNEETNHFQIAQITKIEQFKSFESLYKSYNPEILGYLPDEKFDFHDMYKHYKNEDEQKYGVLAFSFQLLDLDLNKIDNFVFDMDGTLLDEESNLREKNLEAILKLQKMGKKIIIATGRPYYTLQKAINNFPIDYPIITSNGAMLYDNQTHELVEYTAMPKKSAKLMFQKLIELNYEFVIYTTNGMLGHETNASGFFCKRNHYNFLKPQFYQQIDQTLDIDQYQVCKFLILTESRPKKEMQQIEALANSLEGLHGLYSRFDMYDVMGQSASKGNGLYFLAQKEGLDLSRTICFGDSENDISMFEVVKYSASMANGLEKIKDYALLEAPDHNTDWISEFLEKNFKVKI